MAAKALKRAEFGNPILRQIAVKLTKDQILSFEIQQLIRNMLQTLSSLKLGVGLAAPQVGKSISLSVIKVQPTKHRPDVEPFDLILINPQITQTFGRKKQLWEGCISGGAGRAGLFAKIPRYSKIKLKYLDDRGVKHHTVFEGLPAHVIQHEVDHLNGILFVDKVKDTKSFMTYREYMKHIVQKSVKS